MLDGTDPITSGKVVSSRAVLTYVEPIHEFASSGKTNHRMIIETIITKQDASTTSQNLKMIKNYYENLSRITKHATHVEEHKNTSEQLSHTLVKIMKYAPSPTWLN